MSNVVDHDLLAKLDAFFPVARALQADITQCLDHKSNSSAWRRNYVRVLWSLVEGYNSTLGQIAREIVRIDRKSLSAKELKALASEDRMSTHDRIKYTLRAAYKSIGHTPPDLSNANWDGCKALINRREMLSHPKSPSDLNIDPAEWKAIWGSSKWLLQQYFGFVEKLGAIANG